MRRATWLIATLLLSAPLAAPAHAQAGLPPHGWLFGAWTGGLFPPPSTLSAQDCYALPVVIFTRDLVLRAVITDQFYTQRIVETARVTPEGVEFRFSRAMSMPSSSPFGLSAGGSQQAAGFGCISPDILRVQRRTENEISFPGCTDFSYPLVRCSAR